MKRDDLIKTALDLAWHRQTAEASLDRWLQLCEKEQWGEIPRNIDSLISVFGASWYFTRFVFYRGRKSAELIDTPILENFDESAVTQFLSRCLQGESQEQQFEWLRSLKNQAMLQLLLRRLTGIDKLSENELGLTRLAVSTLTVAMKIARIDIENPEYEISILGMGRIAGYEMTFGSDLDLIFLYRSQSEESRTILSEKIRFLLRNMPMQSATGVLYDIDMRLRPHGTSGSLVTSVNSFLEYHHGDREVWERQMMTRCLPIVDRQGMGQRTMAEIRKHIFDLPYDDSLEKEILFIRKRVENELGSPRGKLDIKRGRGGIMDIDFLTHYIQLKNGSDIVDLQTPSTREALRVSAANGLLQDSQANRLLEIYDFFKQLEACLRLFDMKSVSTFPAKPGDDNALVRAMGYTDRGGAKRFMEDYNTMTAEVRGAFIDMLGDAAAS